MQTFTIGITRLAVVYQEITVTAQDPDAAAAKVLQEAKAAGTAGWKVDDVYNDGKPHCEICVSACRDEDGAEHEVTASTSP